MLVERVLAPFLASDRRMFDASERYSDDPGEGSDPTVNRVRMVTSFDAVEISDRIRANDGFGFWEFVYSSN